MKRCNRLFLQGVALGLASLSLVSCGGGGGGGGRGPATPPAVAPSNLTYSEALVIYLMNQRIVANAPSFMGDDPDSFTVAPALPAGLTLDANTGVISGTPTAVSAQQDYLVTARNSAGTSTFVVTITVNPEAPTGLSYPDPVTAQEGIALVPVLPAVGGGAVAIYTVSPALPAGLTLDSATGALSGTPLTPAAAANFTITASNVTGNAVATVTIEVVATAPCDLHYTAEDIVYIPGVAIAPNSPTSSCGAVVTYSIVPALPAGLSLDPITGVISGTPGAASPEVLHTITATNAVGTETVEVRIRVSLRYFFTADSGAVEYDPADGSGAFDEFLWIEEDPNNPGFPHALTGFSMGLKHNPTLVTLIGVQESALLQAMNGGIGPDFFGPNLVHGDGFTIGVVFSFLLNDALEAVGPQHVLTAQYATNPVTLTGNNMGAATMLTFADDLGSPPVTNIVVETGEGARPVVTHGAISLVPTP